MEAYVGPVLGGLGLDLGHFGPFGAYFEGYGPGFGPFLACSEGFGPFFGLLEPILRGVDLDLGLFRGSGPELGLCWANWGGGGWYGLKPVSGFLAWIGPAYLYGQF